jgi:hypothetical protein
MTLSRTLVLVTAFVLALTSVAGGATSASKQRVNIETSGVDDGTFVGRFVLTVHDAGALEGDSGKQTCKTAAERVAVRQGQQVSTYDPTVCTWQGKRGTFVTRSRHDWVDAGNHYFVNTGTWKLIRGTGQYAHVVGGGYNAGVWLDKGAGPWSGNTEGILSRT